MCLDITYKEKIFQYKLFDRDVKIGIKTQCLFAILALIQTILFFFVLDVNAKTILSTCEYNAVVTALGSSSPGDIVITAICPG